MTVERVRAGRLPVRTGGERRYVPLPACLQGELLDYARRIRDRQALIVLATDEHALRQRHLEAIRRLAQTHPMVFIDVATLNPFDSRTGRDRPVYDGTSRRAVPAFLSNARSRDEVATHRAYLAAALNRELTRC